MKPALSLFVLLAATFAAAQVQQITIAAGTPEDQFLQSVSAEKDQQKRTALLQEFMQKFSANPHAVAYGNSQLSQLYQDAGDNAKALEYGDKALAAQPNNLDLAIAQVGIAQKIKANDKPLDYAVRGAAAYQSIARQPKPDGMSDEQFAAKVHQEQEQFRASYEYLEASAFNVVASEQDSKQRMNEIERYTAAFPDSRFQEKLLQLAVYTLGQLKDSARLGSFADKALAASPDGLSTLVVLAAAFVELPDPASITRAEGYARKGMDLAKAQAASDPAKSKQYGGLAQSVLGYALLKEEKIPAAIVELKGATAELKDNPEGYAAALFRLGYAYGKSKRIPEAKAALTEVASISGPYQQPAKGMLAQIEKAPAKPAAARAHK